MGWQPISEAKNYDSGQGAWLAGWHEFEGWHVHFGHLLLSGHPDHDGDDFCGIKFFIPCDAPKPPTDVEVE